MAKDDLEEIMRVFDETMKQGLRAMNRKMMQKMRYDSKYAPIRIPPSSIFATEDELSAGKWFYR